MIVGLFKELYCLCVFTYFKGYIKELRVTSLLSHLGISNLYIVSFSGDFYWKVLLTGWVITANSSKYSAYFSMTILRIIHRVQSCACIYYKI